MLQSQSMCSCLRGLSLSFLIFFLEILYIATPKLRSKVLLWCTQSTWEELGIACVSDKADMVSWQRGSLSLHWARRLSTMTATEANHGRLSCLASFWPCWSTVCSCTMYRRSPIPSSGPTEPSWQHPMDCSLPQDLEKLSQSRLSEMERQKQHCRPLICEQSKPVPLKLVTPLLRKDLPQHPLASQSAWLWTETRQH